MKIGLVCPYNITRGGGVQEVIFALRDGLVARGHEVKIIAPVPRELSDVDTSHVLFLGAAVAFKSPMQTLTDISVSVTTEHIDEALKAEKFDILHFHEPWQPVLSRQILSRSTSVNIATFHAKVPETLMSRTVVKVVTPYTKAVLKYLQELTAVSEAATEYVASLTDAPVTIIPNGIDLAHYRQALKLKKSPKVGQTILFIGRLERRKGMKYLLRAFELLLQENPDASLLVAGDGPDKQKLEAEVESRGLPNVTFLGYVNEETKLRLLAEADLFCSPAIYGESFGIVLLEAMAAGLPIVAGDNSGYASVLQGIGALSLANPQDTPAFARHMQLLLSEEPLRKIWKAWAQKHVEQFNYPRIIDMYENLYRDALKRHRPKHAKT